jgi:hypothetical protein
MYEEVNPTIWDYSKEGDFLEGIFVRVQDDVGANKSKMYSIETSNGVKNVWGSVILDERMALVEKGSKIKITYKGVSKEVSKGKNPAKIFKVEVDRGFKRKE